MAKTCCWIKQPAKNGQAAVYCGKPTRYTMERDDDDQPYRKHDSLCPKHRAQADKDEE